MKYVKKFEGRKPKVNPVPPTEEEILAAYKDKCEDLDDRSYITFDQFFEGLDFDIFLNYDYNKFNSAGVYASRIRGGSTSRWRPTFGGSFELTVKGQRLNFFTSNEYGPICSAGLENSLDWKKRNVFFYAEVNTGGAATVVATLFIWWKVPQLRNYHNHTLDEVFKK
jgi:hypothetical protein